MVYAHLVDVLERRVATQRVMAACAAAAGAEGVEPPEPDDARTEFDAALAAEPEHIDREQFELMQALGLGVR